MYLKSIRIIFISFLLVLNAYAYYLFYRPNQPIHQGYIPQKSMMVFSVNSKEIAGKLAYSALFHRKDFSELIQDQTESDVSWADNVNNGLNILGKLTFMLIPESDDQVPVQVIMADISSRSRLEQYIRSQELQIEELGNDVYYAVQGENSSVAFNNEIAVFLSGDIKPENLKGFASDILTKKFPLRQPGSDEIYSDADFSIGIRPGVKSINDRVSLKGMLGSFIHGLYFSGDFGKNAVDMQYVLETDSVYVPNASEVFVKHEHVADIPDQLKDGIFRMQLTLNPAKWVNWMRDANLLGINDSLKEPVYSGLRNSIGEQFLIRMDAMKLIRISAGDLEKGNTRLIPVPEFSVAFSLNNREPIMLLLDKLHKDSILSLDNGLYRYQMPFGEYYYFHAGKNSLVMATDTSRARDVEFEFHGVSNWFYFNVQNCIDALPTGDLNTDMIKDLLKEISTLHYGFGYSTGVEANRVKFKGSILYNNPEKHSLIETIKFLNNSLALFMIL